MCIDGGGEESFCAFFAQTHSLSLKPKLAGYSDHTQGIDTRFQEISFDGEPLDVGNLSKKPLKPLTDALSTGKVQFGKVAESK